MIEILPNIFCVEVPKEVCGIQIRGKKLWALPSPDNFFSRKYADLPPGSYEIMFTTKDCTEDDASSVRNAVVDAHFDTELQEWRYGFHENNTMIYEKATDALQFLLRSHGLDTNKNYLLVRKTS